MRLTPAQDLADFSGHHQRGRLIEANSQQLWMTVDHLGQVGEAVPLPEMLVNRGAGQKREASLVPQGHHVGVPQRTSPHQIIALDGGSRRAAANHSAALQHLMKQGDSLGVFIGVDKPPLSSPAEPKSAGLLQPSGGFRRFDLSPSAGRQQGDVLRSRSLKELPFVEIDLRIGCGQDHDRGLDSPSQLNEPLGDLIGQPPSADNDE